LINLGDLYVRYIDKLALECNISLKKSARKNEKINEILSAGIPEDKLRRVFEKYLDEQNKGKSKTISTAKRLKIVEDQFKYLITKIDDIEVKLANLGFTDSSINTREITDIKNVIKSKTQTGKSIAVDELLNIEGLNKYTKDMIYLAAMELVDEEIFDVSEGKSNNKIQGHIGRLIRR